MVLAQFTLLGCIDPIVNVGGEREVSVFFRAIPQLPLQCRIRDIADISYSPLYL